MRVPQGLIQLFAAILILLVGAGLVHANDAERFSRGLLWRIELPGVAPSHILGTIHLPDPRVSRPTERTLQALGRSNVLLTELQLDAKGTETAATTLMLPVGQSLKQIIGEADFSAVAGLLAQRGVPPPVADRLRPMAVVSLMVMPMGSSEKPLDLALWEAGAARRMRLSGLESVGEQLASFDGIGASAQAEMLRELVKQHDKIPKLMEQLVALYLSEDTGRAAEVMVAGVPDMPANGELARRMQRLVIDDRNDRMVARMLPHLERGRAFVAVGAAHLPGPRGILLSLSRNGYRITNEPR